MRGFRVGAVIICSLASSLAMAEEARKFCEEPAYRMMSPIPNAPSKGESLLTPEEQKDPAAAQAVALTPGPYGHSELGYRFLARTMGYTGDFSKGHAGVDQWLDDSEANNVQNNGLHKVWDHWVTNASFRLSVPSGAVSKVPSTGSSSMFFKSETERASFRRCVVQDLAQTRCESYRHGQALRKTDSVYYGKAEAGRAVCVVYDHSPLRERQPNTERISQTTTIQNQGNTTTTIQRDWHGGTDDTGKVSGSTSGH